MFDSSPSHGAPSQTASASAAGAPRAMPRSPPMHPAPMSHMAAAGVGVGGGGGGGFGVGSPGMGVNRPAVRKERTIGVWEVVAFVWGGGAWWWGWLLVQAGVVGTWGDERWLRWFFCGGSFFDGGGGFFVLLKMFFWTRSRAQCVCFVLFCFVLGPSLRFVSITVLLVCSSRCSSPGGGANATPA